MVRTWCLEATAMPFFISRAAIAQLGERQTEDLKVPGSIPGLGMLTISQQHLDCFFVCMFSKACRSLAHLLGSLSFRLLGSFFAADIS
jgi:hypothetical protein